MVCVQLGPEGAPCWLPGAEVGQEHALLLASVRTGQLGCELGVRLRSKCMAQKGWMYAMRRVGTWRSMGGRNCLVLSLFVALVVIALGHWLACLRTLEVNMALILRYAHANGAQSKGSAWLALSASHGVFLGRRELS